MQLIQSESIDKQVWDEFVLNAEGTVFALSAYLDATADQWAVLYNSDRSGGMVCPFAKKLGVRVLYAPFFYRYSEWIGENAPSLEELENELKRHFPVADANLKWEIELTDQSKVHQELTQSDFKPNQQVKRMLKKAVNFSVETGFRKTELLDLLKQELSPRIAGIDDHSLHLLDQLVSRFDATFLVQLNLLEETEWKGALWLLKFNDRVLYLKGTVTADAKKNGGMYRLMEQAIHWTFEQECVFDFGGSNATGVRQFNTNWGGKDVPYLHLQWNNAPLWWKMLKSLRQTWNNKSSS